MEFEYNSNKSSLNKKKHGIDFEGAKAIWEADNIVLPAVTKGEKRYMVIGKIKERLYSCIFTIRKEKIRIISCRKTRDKEERIYYEKIEKED